MQSRLKSLAYSMLGCVEDAAEIVQEAHLRLHEQPVRPDSEEAFLYRVVSNLCIDRLRRERVRRRHYPGPWLPEPLASDVLDEAELSQELSLGLMLLMEKLSPAERIAYVLREAFDYSFAEIGALLDVQTASARQRVHRARKRLGEQPPVSMPEQAQREVLEALVGCIAAGDAQSLAALLSEDLVAYTDGGGVVSAARVPIVGAARFSQVILHLAGKNGAQDKPTVRFTHLNHAPAVLLLNANGGIDTCGIAELDAAGLVRRVFLLRNPDKLALLEAQVREQVQAQVQAQVQGE